MNHIVTDSIQDGRYAAGSDHGPVSISVSITQRMRHNGKDIKPEVSWWRHQVSIIPLGESARSIKSILNPTAIFLE